MARRRARGGRGRSGGAGAACVRALGLEQAALSGSSDALRDAAACARALARCTDARAAPARGALAGVAAAAADGAAALAAARALSAAAAAETRRFLDEGGAAVGAKAAARARARLKAARVAASRRKAGCGCAADELPRDALEAVLRAAGARDAARAAGVCRAWREAAASVAAEENTTNGATSRDGLHLCARCRCAFWVLGGAPEHARGVGGRARARRPCKHVPRARVPPEAVPEFVARCVMAAEDGDTDSDSDSDGSGNDIRSGVADFAGVCWPGDSYSNSESDSDGGSSSGDSSGGGTSRARGVRRRFWALGVS